LEKFWEEGRRPGGRPRPEVQGLFFLGIIYLDFVFLNFLKLIAELIGFVRFCRRPGPDREECRGFGTSLSRTEIIIAGVQTHRD